MKKIAVLLLCLILALSFSACGNKSNKDDDEKDKTENVLDNEDSKDDEDTDEEDFNEEQNSYSNLDISDGDYSDFQTALSTFVTDYLNTKTPSIDALDDSEEASTAALELLGLYMVDLTVVEVPMYDALDLTGSGGNKVTGNLMLSGFEATKEKDGDKIRFGYTHKYEEAEFGNEAGDVITSSGFLDTKKKVLVMESKRLRTGQLSSKTIMEIARLDDDSFAMQNIHYDETTMAKGQSCIFLTATTNSMTAILADGEPVVDFGYTSLMDKANVTAEEMARGYTPSMTVKVDGSEVTIEK